MVTSSAPGKVYLFGEHAVVYGEPAVPCAIERRARVTVEARDDARLRVTAGDLSLDGFTVEYEGGTDEAPDVDVPTPLVEAAMGYVDQAVSQARDAADAPAAGIDAATRELGVELDPATVADRAYRVEHAVQDGEASRADTFCSAMGGAVRVEGDDCRVIDAPSLPFVVGYDGGAGDTGALVSGVRELREEYHFAADTVAAIGDVVRRGEGLLADGDVAGLGDPLDFNHGLLSALGVSARSLDEMVWAARESGAHGAKLTGAGGGGCVVALDETPATLTALELTPACEEAFRAELAADGVRRE
jgi:mevalonate kinase